MVKFHQKIVITMSNYTFKTMPNNILSPKDFMVLKERYLNTLRRLKSSLLSAIVVYLLISGAWVNAMDVSQLNKQLNSNNQRWLLTWADEFEGQQLSLRNWHNNDCISADKNSAMCDETQDNIFVRNGTLHLSLNRAPKEHRASKQWLQDEQRLEKLADLMKWLKAKMERPWHYGRYEMRAQLFRKTHYSTSNPLDNSSDMSLSNTANTMLEKKNLTQFHTYAVEWGPSHVNWYIDDVQFSSQTTAQWNKNNKAKTPLQLLVDMAINSTLFDYPDISKSEQYWINETLLIDYFRHYKCISKTSSLSC